MGGTATGFENVVGSIHSDFFDLRNSIVALNLSGENGDDRMVGGSGNDTLNGGAGNDTLTGGAGNDNLYGFQGSDTFIGEIAGIDYLFGGADSDTLDLSALSVAIVSTGAVGSGTDSYQYVTRAGGNQSTDATWVHNDVENFILTEFGDVLGFGPLRTTSVVVHGGGGNDTIVGGVADDILYGDTGTDFLRGSEGGDILYGGTGTDYFRFWLIEDSTNDNPDWVADFEHGIDKFELQQMDADPNLTGNQGFTFATSTATMNTSVGNVVVTEIGIGEYSIGIYMPGDDVADAIIFVTSTNGLTASDFFL